MDIKYVKDNAGNNFFPLVHEKGVVDDNGTTLESKLQSKQDAISDLSTIRSGAAAGATAVQPATTLAGYGITDGYTKSEGQALENTVDNRLDDQDAAIALLNGSEVIVVADHTQVASPNNQKIYREQGSTNYTDWMYQDSTWKEIATYAFPGVDDEPTAESDNLVKSGGVSEKLTELGGEVTETYGSYTENPEFVRVVTDSEGKILYGVKTDGEFVFGVGVPQSIKDYVLAEKARAMAAENSKVDKVEGKGLSANDFTDNEKEIVGCNSLLHSNDYISAEVDFGNKILGGRKLDGTRFENTPFEVQGNRIETVENNNWIDLKTDSEGKIIEGINFNGEKHISKFDEDTRKLIESIVGENTDTSANVISIPALDANFSSPVPVEITGTKGNDDAKYVFDLPLDENAFNIRFKFRITENLLNKNKSAVIAKIGTVNAVTAVPMSLTQLTTTATFNNQTKTNYWPSFKGGISLNGSKVSRVALNYTYGSQNIGLFAFYIKYIGEQEEDVYVSNDGEKLSIQIGNDIIDYRFTDYPTVYSLYKALEDNTDFELSFNEIEGRNSSELAVFDSCKINCLFYSGVNGITEDTITEYRDSAPLYIPYAIGNDWHTVEIVKIGDNVYSICDGVKRTIEPDGSQLSLGGDCGVLFKDLDIHLNNTNDAEIVDDIIISSCNPYIIIHEGHGIAENPSGDGYSESSMDTTIDRLQHIYSIMKSKGYIPVSLNDIAEYYAGTCKLPKRCYVSVFDDFRWSNCLNIEKREVFTRFKAKPGLAIITTSTKELTHNGTSISMVEASEICKRYDFTPVSHTRNHRYNANIKPSLYLQEMTDDIYDADIKGVDGSILVYPYGSQTVYEYDTMLWLGYRLGISVDEGQRRNNINRTKFALTRNEIGLRATLENIVTNIK